MPIVFSDHAILQLHKRRISKTRIIKVVKNPQKILKSYKNRKLRQREFGSTILRVVTVTEGSRITIVSCYYLDKQI